MIRKRQVTSRVNYSKAKTGAKDLSNFVWFSDDSGIETRESDDLNIMTKNQPPAQKLPVKLAKFSSDNIYSWIMNIELPTHKLKIRL